MTPSSSHPENPAVALLARFLAGSHGDLEADFEALCLANPPLADELRSLFAAEQQLRKDLSVFGRVRRTLEDSDYTEGARVGDVIGDFRLITRIASGGQGEVWEAEQLSLGRRVAFKLVLPDRINEKTLALFAREARAGGRLSHPGIVAVFGYGEDDGRHWIAQELVEGGWTLRDFIDDVRGEDELPKNYYRAVATFVAQLAESLQAAHCEGVIHRDVKPQNVLVTEDDHPKLTDFGLARITDELALSMTGDFAGTWLYMSPEQVTAKRVEIDHRTDIFSLGVVMYEMLALVRPFDGDTTHQVAENIIFVEPPDLHKIRSRVPRDLSVICAKALEKRKQSRYPTAADFAADIRRHLANEPIHAKPPTKLVRATKWVQRNPAKSAIATAIAIAFIVVTTLLLEISRQKELVAAERDSALRAKQAMAEERNKAQAAEDVAGRRAYSAKLHAAAAEAKSGNLRAARRLLESCPEEYRGWEWFHLDLALDQSLLTLEGHEDWVNSVAWNPAGTRIVSSSYDGTLRIWDAETGESLLVLEDHNSGVGHVAWSPTGTRIVTGSAHGMLQIWDAETGENLRVLEGHRVGEDGGGRVTSVAWNPTGTRFVSGSQDDTLRTWDAETGESLLVLKGHEGNVRSVAWNPAGTRIVSGSTDGTLRIWDAETGEPLLVSEGDVYGLNSVAWNPAGTRIVSGSTDGTLRIWDAETGEILLVFEGHESSTNSVSWSPTGTRIVSGSYGKTIRIWDAETGENLQTLKGHEDSVGTVAWSPTGTRFVSGSDDRSLRIWDSETGKSVQVLETGKSVEVLQYQQDIGMIAWDPASRRVVSGAKENRFRIWDPENGEVLQTFKGHEDRLRSGGWNPVSVRNAFSSGGDNTLLIWDPETGESLQTLRGHTDVVASFAWNSEGTRIVSGSHDGTLRIWDPETGESLRELTEHKELFICVAWNPTGTRIASGSSHGILRIWDSETGEDVWALEGHEGCVCSVAWNPVGNRIVSGSDDSTLRIWDIETGEHLQTLEGHAEEVVSVAWNHAGTRIASASGDETIRIWDPETGESLMTLKGHEDQEASVAWNSTGTRIVSILSSGGSIIWESRLEEALPMWRGLSVRSQVRRLFRDQLLLEPTLASIEAYPWHSEDDRAMALRMAQVQWSDSVFPLLNNEAWALVDPDRKDRTTDVVFGLRLARSAVGLTPGLAYTRGTLAWALFANGLHDEALAVSKQAIELARAPSKERLQARLTKLKAAINKARNSE